MTTYRPLGNLPINFDIASGLITPLSGFPHSGAHVSALRLVNPGGTGFDIFGDFVFSTASNSYLGTIDAIHFLDSSEALSGSVSEVQIFFSDFKAAVFGAHDPSGLIHSLFTGNDTIDAHENGGGLKLSGEGGDDEIRGGAGPDNIDAGAGDDTLFPSGGADDILGGVGNDTFDFRIDPNSPKPLRFVMGGFAGINGATQSLDGGSDDHDTDSAKLDVLLLGGEHSDYKYTVSFGSGWADTHTTLHLTDGSNITLNTKEIEKIILPPDSIRNPVTLTGGSNAIEMLRLADEVYGHFGETGKHAADPLAYASQGAQQKSEGVAHDAAARGWHPLSAIELGMKPADFNQLGSLHYSFVGGQYQAIDDFDYLFYNGDHAEANALVLSGLVYDQSSNSDKRTLAISLSGTDQWADFVDYTTFSKYYSKFDPLVAALKEYLSNSVQQVDQVLVSAHSLGAGALQYFMQEFAGDGRFKAFTDGSPGSEGAVTDNRVVNFVHTDDPVTLAPLAVGLGGKLSIIAALSALGPVAAAAGLVLATQFDDKSRVGSDVLIDSDVANSPLGFGEHSASLYTVDVAKIVQFANDADAAAPFRDSALAVALRTGAVYQAPDASHPVRIAVGAPIDPDHLNSASFVNPALLYDPIVQMYAADDYVLGNAGNDTFEPHQTLGLLDLNLVASHGRVVDGGLGKDKVELPLGSTFFDWAGKTPDGDGWILNYTPIVDLSTLAKGPPELVGSLYRVEQLVFLNKSLDLPQPGGAGGDAVASAGTPSQYVVNLDGTPVAVQSVAPGQSMLTVDHAFDYTDTGTADLVVMGSGQGDVIVVGSGNVTINALGGSNTIFVKDGTLAGTLHASLAAGDNTVVAGDANDIITAGNGDDDLSGGGGDDSIAPGGGVNTIDGGPAHDTVVLMGSRSEFDIRTALARDGLLHTTVSSLSGAQDSSNTLTSVEKLQFNDGTFALARAQQNNTTNVDGDRFNDVLFQNDADGQIFYEKMVDGQAASGHFLTNPLGTLRAAGSGHVDPAVGTAADLLVQDVASGTGVFGVGPGGIYYHSAGEVQPWHVVAWSLEDDGSADPSVRTTSWTLGAVADVNGDATVDAIIQSTNKGAIYYMPMINGSPGAWGVVSYDLRLADTSTSDYLRFAGAGDINADGFADVVVRNAGDGSVYWADMAGGTFHLPWNQVGAGPLGADFQVVGVGDVNGDGHADVIAQLQSQGPNGLNGWTIWGDSTEANPGSAWKQVTNDAALRTGDGHVAQFARDVVDLNNDGYADVVFHDPTTGATRYWDMNPTTGQHFTDIGTVPGWHVI